MRLSAVGCRVRHYEQHLFPVWRKLRGAHRLQVAQIVGGGEMQLGRLRVIGRAQHRRRTQKNTQAQAGGEHPAEKHGTSIHAANRSPDRFRRARRGYNLPNSMPELDYADYYAHLTDGELAKITSARRTLVPEARDCLDRELAKRQLSPGELKRFRNYRHQEDPSLRKLRRSKLLGKVNELRRMPTLRWPGLLVVMVVSFFLAFAFDHFKALDLFRPIIGTLVVFFLTIRFHWELRWRPWFWLTLLAWAIIHFLVICRVHWPAGWVPAKVWEGYVTLDTVAIFVSIALIERMLEEGPYAPKHSTHNSSQSK